MSNETQFRKIEHIDICLSEAVEAKESPGFSDINFIHKALPELDFKDITTETVFLGKRLTAPIVITSITGGHPETYEINKTIAMVVEELGLGMGVGSQRAALENPSLEYTYSVVKEYAPTVLKIANIGFVQIKKLSIEKIMKAIEMIDADALAIHLNSLQECVQLEGDKSFRNIVNILRKISSEIETPIIVKETGAGISMEIAKLLAEKTYIKAIDVSGLGGTSWSAVEMYRAIRKKNNYMAEIAKTFWNWGIPTAISIVETRLGAPKLKIVGSGGLRSGLDVAKAIALGADVAGYALPALKVAVKGVEELKMFLRKTIDELKITMLLTSSRTIEELKRADIVITGKVREWLETRGINIEEYLEKFR